MAELEDLYSRFNSLERLIAPKEAEIQGLKNEVAIVEAATDDERTRIRNDKLKLTEAQAQIRDLENKLASAREQRVTIEAEIARSQKVIADNEKAITDARSKIKSIEDEIRRLQNTADELRGKFSDLEVEVERIRTEISLAETKAENYRQQIANLNARIDVERGNLVQPDLDNINAMIASLKRAIPTVQGEIDRHYYYCYGAGVEEKAV